jgi:hypothetical protein
MGGPNALWPVGAARTEATFLVRLSTAAPVSNVTDGIIAQVDRQRPIRRIAYAPNKYVSPDGNVSMEFSLGTYGDNMLMSYVPGPIPSTGPSLAQR